MKETSASSLVSRRRRLQDNGSVRFLAPLLVIMCMSVLYVSVILKQLPSQLVFDDDNEVISIGLKNLVNDSMSIPRSDNTKDQSETIDDDSVQEENSTIGTQQRREDEE